ncbi:uncharacterized protein LOC143204815 [Rhynchophorus ferrugineus]|uniref:WKF domain-containing protein n=1 Tax=Rhynchophorus ferrugineus TaxID=354439 RepID=A0A834I9W8_RHYFE|nr:hypothetical protein GWI33_013150 [Rhynchophorus ferrugineus]
MAINETSKKTNKKRRNKNKVSFDEEIITKTNAEILLSEQNNSIKSAENVQVEQKVKKKKKRKISEVSSEASESVKKLKEEIPQVVSENEESQKTNEKSVSGGKKESIRSQKRKKHAKLLEEKKLKAELQYQQKALNYLSKWKHSRSEWKFEKLRQIWLQKNLLDETKIPDEFWENVVEYFSGSKGRCRQEILDEALKVVEKENPDDEDMSEEFKNQLKRARSIVQILQ